MVWDFGMVGRGSRGIVGECFFESFGGPNFPPTMVLTGIIFSSVAISYWCNTSFDAESRAEYDPRSYISIGAIFEIFKFCEKIGSVG